MDHKRLFQLLDCNYAGARITDKGVNKAHPKLLQFIQNAHALANMKEEVVIEGLTLRTL